MTDPGFLAMSSVLRLHRSMKAVVDQELTTCCRLRLVEYEILKELQADAGMRLLGEVARQLLVHATTVSIASERLARRGLVTRDSHPGDRRATLVSLTDDGRSLAEAATATLARVDFGLTGLTTAQVTSLADTIRAARTDRVTPG